MVQQIVVMSTALIALTASGVTMATGPLAPDTVVAPAVAPSDQKARSSGTDTDGKKKRPKREVVEGTGSSGGNGAQRAASKNLNPNPELGRAESRGVPAAGSTERKVEEREAEAAEDFARDASRTAHSNVPEHEGGAASISGYINDAEEIHKVAKEHGVGDAGVAALQKGVDKGVEKGVTAVGTALGLPEKAAEAIAACSTAVGRYIRDNTCLGRAIQDAEFEAAVKGGKAIENASDKAGAAFSKSSFDLSKKVNLDPGKALEAGGVSIRAAGNKQLNVNPKAEDLGLGDSVVRTGAKGTDNLGASLQGMVDEVKRAAEAREAARKAEAARQAAEAAKQAEAARHAAEATKQAEAARQAAEAAKPRSVYTGGRPTLLEVLAREAEEAKEKQEREEKDREWERRMKERAEAREERRRDRGSLGAPSSSMSVGNSSSSSSSNSMNMNGPPQHKGY
jgi:hypothetical protein